MTLPPELLRVRRRRGTIRPLYAAEDKLGLARTLISVFKAHVDKRRRELKEALRRCEEIGYNYKLVRGLAAVLEDRCIFQSRAFVDPAEARRAVFEEAGERVIATEEERRRVLAAAALRLGVSAEDVEASLYADLWDEQVLADFSAPTPRELLKEYNFALTLALLNQASRMELTYPGRDEGLEWLGEALGRGRLETAGGMSILTIETRPSRQAGKRAALLEALLSGLMLRGDWRLEAEVTRRTRTRRVHRFGVRKASDGKLITPSDLKRRVIPRVPARPKPTSRALGDIVVIDALASELGVTEAEARARLERAGGGYIDLGGVFIAPEKLGELEEAMTSAPDMRLSTVVSLLRKLGCSRPLPVLEALGYAVEWAEDRGESRVYRLKGLRGTT